MDIDKAKRSISELQQQALIAGTRCSTLKSQLNYMKMLYYDTHPRAEEIKAEIDSNNETANEIPPAETNSTNFLRELQSIYKAYTEDSNIKPQECFTRTPRSDEASLKSSREHAESEQVKDSNLVKEPSSLTPRTYILSKTPRIFPRCELPERKSNLPEHQQYPYQNHPEECSVEHRQGEEVSDDITAKAESRYLLEELASLKQDPRKQEVMHISKNIKSYQMAKRRNVAREKKERVVPPVLLRKKNSSSKLDEILSVRVKRKRGRVRSCNSRCTVSTNLTNLTGRRDSKKRKQRGYSLSYQPKDVAKEPRNSREVVEIYHNSAAHGGSGCVISGRRSKSENQSVQVKSPSVIRNWRTPSTDLNQGTLSSRPELQRERTEEPEPKVCEAATSPILPVENCNHSHSGNAVQTPYDPIAPRSYEMPTLASKLKRADRCYFGRFNFRNIPFVVGTSVTPSHNLGLNIQQVLNMMKTRQPAMNGIAPLLIRKVSKGMEPMSVLIDQINDQWTVPLDVRSQMIHASHHKENLFPCYSATSNARRENKNAENASLKHRPTTGNRNTNERRILMPFVSQHCAKNRSASGAENGFENGEVYAVNSVSCSQSTRGIREVLVNLHDQFEGMNTRYEELQAKVEKSADENLQKEMFDLEKELNAKEEEINAMVGLYKEVMALKHQMKKLQDKNSLVYISTEVPMNPNKYASIPLMLNKSYPANMRQVNRRRSNGIATAREPSVSVRLTGLLRQIQTFQKQLKFAS